MSTIYNVVFQPYRLTVELLIHAVRHVSRHKHKHTAAQIKAEGAGSVLKESCVFFSCLVFLVL